MARLCLCLNQVAHIRNSKNSKVPDPVAFAIAAEMAGIDGIVVQLRQDRSDITDRDINLLKEVVRSHLNIAMPLNDEMMKKVLNWLPDMVTLLPSTSSATSDDSLDVFNNLAYLEEAVQTFRAHNVVVNMLIEPEPQQIRSAARAQTDYVQFNTSALAAINDLGELGDQLQQLKSATLAANKIGLGISVGRGLETQLIQEMNQLEHVEEYNVGWAIISRAMLVGLDKAIYDFKKLIEA